LVISTVYWLMHFAVLGRNDQPGVIDKVGQLLHNDDLLPLKYLAPPKGKTVAIPFSDRIAYHFSNNIRIYDSGGKPKRPLQVASSAELTTPQRAMERAGFLQRVENTPIQGHSGGSIIGRGRGAMPPPDSRPTPSAPNLAREEFFPSSHADAAGSSSLLDDTTVKGQLTVQAMLAAFAATHSNCGRAKNGGARGKRFTHSVWTTHT
jgi:hypothetical protein